MAHVLPNLPYDQGALEPHISAHTLSFHHGKHHQAYVTNLNTLIPGTVYEDMALEDIILKSHQQADHVGIFNNAAQIWNHTFFWHSMTPNGGGQPTGRLLDLINKTFGNYEGFITAFKQAATTQFGSGWAWLVLDQGQLKVTKTGNADLPMVHGQTALLTCDVWEHAYYLDYQNRRPNYVEVFLNNLINWAFAEENLAKA